MSAFIFRLAFMAWLIVKQCLCVPYDGARTYLTPLCQFSEGWSRELANSWQSVYDPEKQTIKEGHLRQSELTQKKLSAAEEICIILVLA